MISDIHSKKLATLVYTPGTPSVPQAVGPFEMIPERYLARKEAKLSCIKRRRSQFKTIMYQYVWFVSSSVA
jgi:hypothetical protein